MIDFYAAFYGEGRGGSDFSLVQAADSMDEFTPLYFRHSGFITKFMSPVILKTFGGFVMTDDARDRLKLIESLGKGLKL